MELERCLSTGPAFLTGVSSTAAPQALPAAGAAGGSGASAASAAPGPSGLGPQPSLLARRVPPEQLCGSFVTLQDIFALILELKEDVEELMSALYEEDDTPSPPSSPAQKVITSSTTVPLAPSKSLAPMPEGVPQWPTSGIQRQLW